MKKIRKPPQAGGTIQPSPPNSSWRPHGWRLLALWALVLAAYSNSFDAGLIFDNAAAISQDPRIRAVTPQNLCLIATQEYWYTNPTSGLYRPFTTLSYLVNYAVLGNGTRPAGYHWINLAIHVVNVSLVYGLGILILGEADLALVLAALWGVHPLLTESVTNIVGRADLLAGFSVLAGLLCYVRGAAEKGRRKLAWFAGMVAAQAIGLFSKENAAVLPGIMLLYDLTWPHGRSWRNRAPAYAALLLPFAAFFLLRSQLQSHMHVVFSENPLIGAGFWEARLTAIKVIGKFLWLFFWPAQLSADYSYNAVPLFGAGAPSGENAKALLALAVCMGAVTLAVRWYRTQKALFFFLVFFFVALSATSNLVIIIGSIMGERFVYLPLVGLAGCAVVAIRWIGRQTGMGRQTRMGRQTKAAWMITGLVCLAFAARTYARNFDWYDDRSLWTSAVSVSPGSARAHNNLGNVLMEIQGELPQAISEFEAALRIRPDYAEAHYNLGKALAQVPGSLPEAVSEYQAALRNPPDYSAAQHYANVHISLGNALARMPGRLSDAISEYQAAIRDQPDRADAHYNLGNALAPVPGRLEEAISEWNAALRINPDLAEAHYNLGIARAQSPGQSAEAIAQFEATLRIQPDHARAHNNLGSVLSRIPGRLPEAIAQYQAALRIEPGLAEAHYNLGNALLETPGRTTDAITEFEAALRIRPSPAAQEMVNRLKAGHVPERSRP